MLHYIEGIVFQGYHGKRSIMFLTVGKNIMEKYCNQELFHQPTLMYNFLYSLTIF